MAVPRSAPGAIAGSQELIFAAAGGSWYAWHLLRSKEPNFWNSAAVPANYMGAQLKEEVAQAFALFDQASRYQIEFPSGWRDLQLTSGGSD